MLPAVASAAGGSTGATAHQRIAEVPRSGVAGTASARLAPGPHGSPLQIAPAADFGLLGRTAAAKPLFPRAEAVMALSTDPPA